MALIDRDRLTCIGTVKQAYGVKGELKVAPLTDTPAYYEQCGSVILETKQGLRDFRVSRMRAAGAHWIVALDGLDDRDGAESFCGARVLLQDSELRPLQPGEYFRHDLVGCMVETLAGKSLGRVGSVMETGANDVLVVGEKGVLVPMLAEVVKDVDLGRKTIRIEPLPGLLEVEEE